MEELYYNALDLLKQMIAIPSFSREEQNVANLLQDYMTQQGQTVQREGNNLWICSPYWDNKQATILLNSHIDTVKPVSAWTKDPFTAEEDEEVIYGLGSNDAGASVVSLLHAFLYLSQKPQKYNLIFLASCEEEVSGKQGIELVLPLLPPITFGIVGEPTEMHPALAEKGLMVVDCIAQGKSGHAARNEGVNAIYNAIKDIEWIQSYQFPKTSDLLGPIKMSVTMIEAGTQHNVVPDTCKFVVDIRSNEQYSNQEIFEILQTHLSSSISARSFRLNSSRIDITNPFVQRAILTGKIPYGSPTLSDQALISAPTVKMGPGKSERSHTADEFIKKQEIREAIELYIKLLDNLEL